MCVGYFSINRIYHLSSVKALYIGRPPRLDFLTSVKAECYITMTADDGTSSEDSSISFSTSQTITFVNLLITDVVQ